MKRANVQQISTTETSKESKPLWKKYRVRWDFLTSLCSSTPANPELIKAWLDARKPDAMPPSARSIPEIQEEVFASVGVDPNIKREAEEQKSLLVFQRNDGALVMRAATVRAHMKDCARVISAEHVGKIKGERSFATRLINCSYLDEREYWLPVLRQDTGAPFREATGFRDKAIHTWQGNALKRFEFVMGARLEFGLKILNGNVKQEDLETVFQYGGVHGYAGERGDGEGKYTFSIHEV
jgi:hypothetical protein